MRTPAAALTLLLPLALTGCAMTTTATPTVIQGAAIQGKVHGGQQPVVGTHVYLFAANTTGYGGSGIAPSAANASIPLLNTADSGVYSDSVGAYVLTDTSGSFSITGDYTCTPGQQVYLYALGGNPTYPSGTANSAIGELAILGACPTADNFATATPFVIINEVSTIAAAYAFAGFASDATHVSSSGTALAKIGIANAFANAANLVSLSGGNALTTTPAGNGTVLTARLNTLANILASCVNTTGPTSTPCSTLFTSTPSLTATPVTPTDTATAAINIAHSPTANTTALYGLSTASPPFGPAYAVQPNDLSLWIEFTAGLVYPTSIAFDAYGNAWITSADSNAVVELSANGTVLSGASGFTAGGLNLPVDIAIDPSGNVWVPNLGNNSLTKLSGITGAPIASYTGGGLNAPWKIAMDGAGNAWVINFGSQTTSPAASISKFLASGTPATTSALYQLPTNQDYSSLAVDGSGNAWVWVNGTYPSYLSGSLLVLAPSTSTLATYPVEFLQGYMTAYGGAMDSKGDAWFAGSAGGVGTVAEVSHSGSSLTGSQGFDGGGLYTSRKIAIDGAGTAWIANEYDSVTGISTSGQFLTGTGDGILLYTQTVTSAALDGSGDFWTCAVSGIIEEAIGIAAPVITPIAAGLPTIPTADGSSNLGTRP